MQTSRRWEPMSTIEYADQQRMGTYVSYTICRPAEDGNHVSYTAWRPAEDGNLCPLCCMPTSRGREPMSTMLYADSQTTASATRSEARSPYVDCLTGLACVRNRRKWRTSQLFVDWFLTDSTNVQAYLKNGSVSTSVRVATLRQKLQITFCFPQSQNTGTWGKFKH